MGFGTLLARKWLSNRATFAASAAFNRNAHFHSSRIARDQAKSQKSSFSFGKFLWPSIAGISVYWLGKPNEKYPEQENQNFILGYLSRSKNRLADFFDVSFPPWNLTHFAFRDSKSLRLKSFFLTNHSQSLINTQKRTLSSLISTTFWFLINGTPSTASGKSQSVLEQTCFCFIWLSTTKLSCFLPWASKRARWFCRNWILMAASLTGFIDLRHASKRESTTKTLGVWIVICQRLLFLDAMKLGSLLTLKTSFLLHLGT